MPKSFICKNNVLGLLCLHVRLFNILTNEELKRVFLFIDKIFLDIETTINPADKT
ncbi:hypothetical protein [Candidatus Pantoea edessiphila]|uniref:hypothetical protein n=1 Tax=Candidatus Pantoea edessiphila TaxID=2044610 RepID=UPI00131A2B4C|nr:hypothetical protein [Candidatus Pantoea edessiphila]